MLNLRKLKKENEMVRPILEVILQLYDSRL